MAKQKDEVDLPLRSILRPQIFGWLVGWFVGWLFGWLFGWLVVWLVGQAVFSSSDHTEPV